VEQAMSGGMTDREITRLVNRYIGVSSGYLGLPEPFSYRTHGDFYSEYCDLHVNFDGTTGTTRERFISILDSLPPRDQAKVLRGVVERFPPEASGSPDTRPAAHDEVLALIARLESGPLVSAVTPQITSEIVLRALTDAQNLILTSGPTSAIDRVHTMLHGYLRAVCDAEGITYGESDSMVALLRKLEVSHARLQNLGPRALDVKKVLNSFANVFDAMLPVRNQASVAHPNAELLAEPEALLVINAGRTILHYLDSKLS
jgi:hypothetical protein